MSGRNKFLFWRGQSYFYIMRKVWLNSKNLRGPSSVFVVPSRFGFFRGCSCWMGGGSDFVGVLGALFWKRSNNWSTFVPPGFVLLAESFVCPIWYIRQLVNPRILFVSCGHDSRKCPILEHLKHILWSSSLVCGFGMWSAPSPWESSHAVLLLTISS